MGLVKSSRFVLDDPSADLERLRKYLDDSNGWAAQVPAATPDHPLELMITDEDGLNPRPLKRAAPPGPESRYYVEGQKPLKGSKPKPPKGTKHTCLLYTSPSPRG